MTIETSKNLGGVGAILLLVGIFISGFTYGIVPLIGLILVLYALHSLANIYNERAIFNNAIYGIVVGIIGAFVAGVVAVIAVLSSLSTLETFVAQFYPGWTPGDWASLSGQSPTVPNNIDYSSLLTFITAVLAVFIVVIVFAVVATYFFRRSLKLLSTKSRVGLFSTAGLVLFIGAILLILLIVPGLIVMWIALLLLAIAFFQIKPHSEEQPIMTSASPPPPMPV